MQQHNPKQEKPHANVESTQTTVQLYRQLLERLAQIEQQAQTNMSVGWQLWLDDAKQVLFGLKTVERDEIDNAAYFLQRDLQHMRAHLQQQRHSLATWLTVDIALIEDTCWQWLTHVADNIVLAQQQFQDDLDRQCVYHAGDVTSPGVFACMQCKKTQQFITVVLLKACEHCGHTEFTRQVSSLTHDE